MTGKLKAPHINRGSQQHDLFQMLSEQKESSMCMSGSTEDKSLWKKKKISNQITYYFQGMCV